MVTGDLSVHHGDPREQGRMSGTEEVKRNSEQPDG